MLSTQQWLESSDRTRFGISIITSAGVVLSMLPTPHCFFFLPARGILYDPEVRQSPTRLAYVSLVFSLGLVSIQVFNCRGALGNKYSILLAVLLTL